MVSVSGERPGATAPTRDALLSNLTFHAWRDAGVETLTELAGYERREHAVTLPNETLRVAGAGVTPGLLSMLGAAPARGRLFAPDGPADAADVLVSDAFWRGALGARSDALGSGLLVDGRFHTIVGITPPGFFFPDREVLLWTRFEPPRAAPEDGNPRVTAFFGLGRLRPGASAGRAAAEGTAVAQRLTRSCAGPGSAVRGRRSARRTRAHDGRGEHRLVRLTAVDPSYSPARRVRGRLSLSFARPRFAAAVLGAFALVSLLRATAGLYGAVSFAVARRRYELGVHSALGAGRGALVRLVVRDGLRATGAGLVVGLAAAALVATPLLTGILFGVAPPDPVTFVTGPALLALTALAACLLSGLRATADEPARVLRCD